MASPSHSRSRPSRRARAGANGLAFLLGALLLGGSAADARADADEGAKIFQAKCAACHTIGGGRTVGPDLQGVVQKRDPAWLSRWIQEPDKMIAEKDPLAVQLLNEFQQVPMPNRQVTKAEAESVIAHLRSKSAGGPAASSPAAVPPSAAPADRQMGGVQSVALWVFALISAVIVAVFAFVGKSTGTPQSVDMKSAYKLRKVLFISGLAVVCGLLALTLPKNPYAAGAEPADQILYTTAQQFSFTYSREPAASAADLARIATLPAPEVRAGALVEFRVTSLDATHGFAIYDPKGAVVAQTQAMPGYVNRLRVRFGEPGTYPVLCLEYCGAAHHLMRSAVVVR